MALHQNTNRDEEVSPAKPPIFLLGSARSGTKMLRELLNNSPRIWIPYVESVFIPHFTNNIQQYRELGDWENFKKLATDIQATRAAIELSGRGIHIDAKQWYDSCEDFDWPSVLEAFFHQIFLQEDDGERNWTDLIWGDKTPDYLTDVPLLSKLYPDSRFVHIIRDPRDISLSAKKVWNKHPVRTVQLWADEVSMARSAGKQLGDARYYELRYEDLLEDVDGQLEGVFHFLGLPTPENAGQLARSPERYGDAQGRSDVKKDNKEKWKTDLSSKYQQQIEGIVGDTLSELGYQRLYPDVKAERTSPLRMKVYRYMDIWHMIRFRRREQGSWYKAFKFIFSR